MPEAVFLICLVSLVGVGIGLALLATPFGVGLGSDSAVYVAAARNWLGGYGLSWLSGGLEVSPMTLHAPLYPLVLAGLQVVGVGCPQGMRAINASCYGMQVFLVGFLLWRMTGRPAFSLLGCFILVSTGELIETHSWGMSDPLYLSLGLLGIALLDSFLQSRNRLFLVGAGVAAGLAYLARYIGISLAVAGLLALMLDSSHTPGTRLRNSLLFTVLAAGAMVVWSVRNVLLTGQTAGRMLAWNPVGARQVIEVGLPIVLDWFLPLRLVDWLVHHVFALLCLAAVATLVLALVLRPRPISGELDSRGGSSRSGAVTLVGLYLVVYFGFIILTSLLFRPGSDVNQRILSPAYIGLLVLGIYLLCLAWQRSGWIVRVVIVLLCAGLVRNKVVYEYWVVHGLREDGQGYASTSWRNSETIAALKALSPETIYTDDIAAVYLLADRHSYTIPRRLDAVSNAYLESYPAALDAMRERLREQGAVLVLFKPASLPPDLAPLDDLTQGLIPIHVTRDGSIYAYASGGGNR